MLVRCLGLPFREASYELLVELASGSSENSKLIIKLILGMHHKFDPSLAKEFEVSYIMLVKRARWKFGTKCDHDFVLGIAA